ncbi:MAG: hypothetical protein JWP31_20, partial [Aeromicrobium sp.]|nr:hypothetical protein [Aeromicrobium sp.]
TTTSILGAAGVLRVASTDPDLLVVTSCGEPPRDVFERAGLLRLDHLPVVIDEDQVRIGPLVRPGRTPCMSCHDLHRTDWDPAWPALVHQLGSSVVGRLPSVDPLTAHAAALELAAEVLAHLDGRPTRTAGRCLVVGPRHDGRASWPVAFHPSCTCDVLNAA